MNAVHAPLDERDVRFNRVGRDLHAIGFFANVLASAVIDCGVLRKLWLHHVVHAGIVGH